MNEYSQPGFGKISVHADGMGAPTPELVEKRAREIAMIDERNPDEFTDADWEQAKDELTGVEHSHSPEVDSDVAAEISERDDIPGATGHRAPKSEIEGDDSVGEELVNGGIEDAAHDQML